MLYMVRIQEDKTVYFLAYASHSQWFKGQEIIISCLYAVRGTRYVVAKESKWTRQYIFLPTRYAVGKGSKRTRYYNFLPTRYSVQSVMYAIPQSFLSLLERAIFHVCLPILTVAAIYLTVFLYRCVRFKNERYSCLFIYSYALRFERVTGWCVTNRNILISFCVPRRHLHRK